MEMTLLSDVVFFSEMQDWAFPANISHNFLLEAFSFTDLVIQCVDQSCYLVDHVSH
jgi:hypothetical protein